MVEAQAVPPFLQREVLVLVLVTVPQELAATLARVVLVLLESLPQVPPLLPFEDAILVLVQ